MLCFAALTTSAAPATDASSSNIAYKIPLEDWSLPTSTNPAYDQEVMMPPMFSAAPGFENVIDSEESAESDEYSSESRLARDESADGQIHFKGKDYLSPDRHWWTAGARRLPWQPLAAS